MRVAARAQRNQAALEVLDAVGGITQIRLSADELRVLAAQFMKVTEDDILEAIKDKSLKAKKVGKAYRISKDNLESFMNS